MRRTESGMFICLTTQEGESRHIVNIHFHREPAITHNDLMYYQAIPMPKFVQSDQDDSAGNTIRWWLGD